MDAKMVFDDLRGLSRARSIFGDVIFSCRNLMGSFESGYFNLVNREPNVVVIVMLGLLGIFGVLIVGSSLCPLSSAFPIFVILVNFWKLLLKKII
ncbi:hypothetical protein ACS0TY_008518 [Phlomoides rotata]